MILSFVYYSCTLLANDISGDWISSQKDLKVRVYKVGNTYEAKVLWMPKEEDGSPPKDSDNPDPKLRNRSMIGLRVLWGMVYNKETHEYEHGTAYVHGREFCGKAKLNPDGTLKVTGYVCVLKFLKKSETFIRI